MQVTSRHGAFARVLSLLLLTFIFYGTAVEAAHTHRTRARASTIAGVSDISVPVSESETNTNVPGCGDCLICQLHQHFSTGQISVPATIAPPSQSSRFLKPNTVSVHSHTSTPQTGRAPPFTY